MTGRTIQRWAAVLLLFFFTSGCAMMHPHTLVEVQSYAKPEAKSLLRYTYDKPEDPTNLADSEYRQMIDRAMNEAGFVKAAIPTVADFSLKTDFGSSGPELSQYTYQEPVYGQTGVEVHRRVIPTRSHGYIEKTTYEPVYDVVGYQDRIKTETIYRSHITLTALRKQSQTDPHLSKTKPASEEAIWQVSITYAGSQNDLRWLFPILLAGGRPYFGLSSGSERQISVQNDDPSVNHIRSGVLITP